MLCSSVQGSQIGALSFYDVSILLARTHRDALRMCLYSFRVDSPSSTFTHQVLMHSDCQTGRPTVLEVCRCAVYRSAPLLSARAFCMPCLHVRICMIVVRPDELMLRVIICSMPDLHCGPVAWATCRFCVGRSVPLETYFNCSVVLFAHSCHILAPGQRVSFQDSPRRFSMSGYIIIK